MSIDYKKILPEESLLHSIDAYCFYKKEDNTIITDCYFPTGKPAIIFHLGEHFSYFNQQGKWLQMYPVNFLSCVTGAVAIKSGGKTDTIAVIVTPASIYAMYKHNPGKYNWPVDARPYIEMDLFEQLAASKDAEFRTTILNTYFAEKLINYNPQDDLFKSICDFIILKKGITDRNTVAKDFGISESYVHKLFHQRLGVSFKPYVQTVRISNIIQEIYSHKQQDWFEIAEKYGYYDQAHFIKDFKMLTGKTPKQYYQFDKTMSAVFSAIV